MNFNIVFDADFYDISRFFTTFQTFEIFLFKTPKKAILAYFRVTIDTKQKYLKSEYFICLGSKKQLPLRLSVYLDLKQKLKLHYFNIS